MKVLVWVAEATWPACVDLTNEMFPDADVTLLAVVAEDLAALASDARSGLWGRQGKRGSSDAGLMKFARESAETIITAASQRLGRPASPSILEGRPERVVTAASKDANVLILARDGDLSRLGPHSLGKDTRFVVDHAPCSVMLAWPTARPPALESIPPPPKQTPPQR